MHVMVIVASLEQKARWQKPQAAGRALLLRHDRTGDQTAAFSLVMAKKAGCRVTPNRSSGPKSQDDSFPSGLAVTPLRAPGESSSHRSKRTDGLTNSSHSQLSASSPGGENQLLASRTAEDRSVS